MGKHKYLVTFYRKNRITPKICTRTWFSTLKFALKHMQRFGWFTIKRLK